MHRQSERWRAGERRRAKVKVKGCADAESRARSKENQQEERRKNLNDFWCGNSFHSCPVFASTISSTSYPPLRLVLLVFPVRRRWNSFHRWKLTRLPRKNVQRGARSAAAQWSNGTSDDCLRQWVYYRLLCEFDWIFCSGRLGVMHF